MAGKLSAKLTYANVVSTLCLFLLLGGGAYAAVHLKKNSVGTKQIKKNAVTSSKIKNGAVTQTKISASAQAALKGQKGDQGPPGPSTGPAGGDLSGSYPNPTLRAPTNVQISQQPPLPAATVDCGTTFDTFCGDVSAGNYWNQPSATVSYLGYYIEPSGFIQLQGSVLQVGSPPYQVFRLPPGRRPSAPLFFEAAHEGPTTNFGIGTDGYVTLYSGDYGNGKYFDLTSVRFRIGS